LASSEEIERALFDEQPVFEAATQIGFANSLAQKVFSYRREDVYQNHFLVKHCRPMQGARWKMKHITGLGKALFIANGK